MKSLLIGALLFQKLKLVLKLEPKNEAKPEVGIDFLVKLFKGTLGGLL